MKKNGFTLLELILVLGLIALITIGTYVLYNKRNESRVAAAEATYILIADKNITATASTLKSGFTAQESANALTLLKAYITNTKQLIDSKTIPEQLINGNTVQSLWGSVITFDAGSYSDPVSKKTYLYYTLKTTTDNKAICGGLLSNEDLNNRASFITVNNVPAKSFGNRAIKPEVIATNCELSPAVIQIGFVVYEYIYTDRVNDDCTDCGTTRTKEKIYNIAPGYTNISDTVGSNPCNNIPGTDSTREATYNNESGVCVCNNVNMQWNGAQCVPIWTPTATASNGGNSGFCPLGYGWNRAATKIQDKCVLLTPNDAAKQTQQLGFSDRLPKYLENEQKNYRDNTNYTPLGLILVPKAGDLGKQDPTDSNKLLSMCQPNCLNPNYNKDMFASSPNAPTKINIDTQDENLNRLAGRKIPPNVGFNGGGTINYQTYKPFTFKNTDQVANSQPIDSARPMNTIPVATYNPDGTVDKKYFGNIKNKSGSDLYTSCVQSDWSKIDGVDYVPSSRCETLNIVDSYIDKTIPDNRSTLEKNTTILNGAITLDKCKRSGKQLNFDNNTKTWGCVDLPASYLN